MPATPTTTAPQNTPHASAQDAICLRAVRFGWPGAAAPTLDIPELRVPRGQRLFLRGPSGCGKSTLLSLMAGVLVAAIFLSTILRS